MTCAQKRKRTRLQNLQKLKDNYDSNFCLGDYQHELGIIHSNYAPKGATAGPGGAVVYWHVDNVAAALEKVTALGAKEYEPLTNRGTGFITASVLDPFGNILGIMYNPHYLEILDSTKKA
jgi:predicted enzyme related to lactoylglutathione lyase